MRIRVPNHLSKVLSYICEIWDSDPGLYVSKDWAFHHTGSILLDIKPRVLCPVPPLPELPAYNAARFPALKLQVELEERVAVMDYSFPPCVTVNMSSLVWLWICPEQTVCIGSGHGNTWLLTLRGEWTENEEGKSAWLVGMLYPKQSVPISRIKIGNGV